MVEWGGHHGGWGGFGPPSYIVKKCPVPRGVVGMASGSVWVSTLTLQENIKENDVR
jgi:hypothetical protein